jgi:hypothetical protein
LAIVLLLALPFIITWPLWAAFAPIIFSTVGTSHLACSATDEAGSSSQVGSPACSPVITAVPTKPENRVITGAVLTTAGLIMIPLWIVLLVLQKTRNGCFLAILGPYGKIPCVEQRLVKK